MNKYDSDEYWNKFLAGFKDYPQAADRIVEAIYLARGTLARNEQPIMDDLINAIHTRIRSSPKLAIICLDEMRGILSRDHDPVGIAADDLFWPYWRNKSDPPPQTNHLHEIANQLAALRQELDHLKVTVQKKRN